jgi:hypothetical protein
MASERSRQQYRRWYAKLLRLHSKPYHDRFGEGMEQTFNDLLQERASGGGSILSCVFWLFIETSIGIIKENRKLLMPNKNIIRLAIVTVCILMIPLIAMQFTDEVTWSVFDFIIMGGLIFGAGLAYELIAKRSGAIAYRVAVGMALGGMFLLIWLNMAVGIIGSEENPINLLYALILVIGFLGSIIARLQPQGMVRVMFAMAAVQMLIPVIALFVVSPEIIRGEPMNGIGIFVLNGLFATLFTGSGLLFRQISASPAT